MSTVLRFQSEGIDEIRRQLEALGEKGARALKALDDAGTGVATSGLRGIEGQSRRTSAALTNLSFQFNDVVSGLVSGQEPMRIFAQQGGQIVQVFQQSGIGVTGVLKQAASAIGGMINPLTLAGTAAAAVVGTIIAAYRNYTGAQEQFAASLRGVGAASGATVSDLERIAEAAARSGNITVGTARDIENALVRTGKVGVASLSGLIDFTSRYAELLGGDTKTAIKDVTAAMADSEAGILKLTDKFGLLSDAEYQHIKALIDSGNQQEAFRELTEKGLPTLNESVGVWQRLKIAISEAFTALGQAGGNAPWASTQAQIDAIDRELERLRKNAATEEPRLYEKKITALEESRALLVRQLQVARDNAEARRLETEANRQSRAAGDLARSLQPGATHLANIETLRAGLATRKMDAQAAAAAQRALTAETKAYNDAVARAAGSTRGLHTSVKATNDALSDQDPLVQAVSGALKDYDATMKEGRTLAESLRTPWEVFNDSIAHNKELLDAGAISAETFARANVRAAETLAQTDPLIKAVNAGLKEYDDRQKKTADEAAAAIKRNFEEAKRQADSATDRIVGNASDMLAKVSNDWKDTWSSLGDFTKNLMRQVFAEIAANAIIRPIVAPIVNAFYGVSGAGAAGGVPVSTGGLTGSGGLGTLGTVSQAFSLGRMLSTGFSQQGFNGIASFANRGVDALFGTSFGASPLPPGFVGPPTAAQAGANGFLGLGAMGNGLLSAGASLALSLFSGQGVGKSLVSAATTGIGAAFGGPIGGLIGNVIGGILGSLFGNKKPPRTHLGVFTFADAAARDAAADSMTTSGNRYDTALGSIFQYGKHTPADADAAMQKIITELDKATAALFSEAELAKVKTALQTTDPFISRQRASLDGDMFKIVKDRLTTELKAVGIGSDTIANTIFGGIAKDNANVDQLAQAAQNFLTQRRSYLDTIEAVLNPKTTTQAEQALKAIDDQYKQMIADASTYALSVDEINKAHQAAIEQEKAGFVSGVSDQLLQLTDPAAYARKQAEAANDNLLKEATAQGVLSRIVDGGLTVAQAIAKLRELNVASAVSQFADALKQAKATIADFLQGITGTTASPLPAEVVLANARAAYSAALGQAQAAGPGGLTGELSQNLTSRASALLDLARQMFASGGQYFSIFEQIRRELAPLAGTGLNGLPGFASGGSFTVGGKGGIDTNLVAFRATRGERVTIAPPTTTANGNAPTEAGQRETVSALERGFARLSDELREVKLAVQATNADQRERNLLLRRALHAA